MNKTAEQMRDLDEWIFQNVFSGEVIAKEFPKADVATQGYWLGYKLKDSLHGEFPNGGGMHGWGWCSSIAAAEISIPDYTTDPAASDVLDDAILGRLGSDGDGLSIYKKNGSFHMIACISGRDVFAEHPDKKVCRALFARELWKDGAK